jgi:hypothetical protein
LLVFEHEKEAASSILTARAIGARQSTLLIHIAENSEVFRPGDRDSDLRMIEVLPGAPVLSQRRYGSIGQLSRFPPLREINQQRMNLM